MEALEQYQAINVAFVIIKISLLWIVNSLHKLYTIRSCQHLCEEAAIIILHFTVE